LGRRRRALPRPARPTQRRTDPRREDRRGRLTRRLLEVRRELRLRRPAGRLHAGRASRDRRGAALRLPRRREDTAVLGGALHPPARGDRARRTPLARRPRPVQAMHRNRHLARFWGRRPDVALAAMGELKGPAMSNDITTYQQPTEAPTVTHAGGEMIAATARALVDAHNIGSALCKTSFVPKHFQGKPEEAAAAILYGASIDMDPITALQNVFVISGKPALYARGMVAVVLSKGHKIWTEEESEGSVTVAGQRKGSDTVERVTWTSEMAKRAGYTSNSKYASDPRSMLYARASGDVARRIAPDALLGMAQNIEELTVDRVADTRPAPAPQQSVSVASLTQQATPATETEPEPPAQTETLPVEASDEQD